MKKMQNIKGIKFIKNKVFIIYSDGPEIKKMFLRQKKSREFGRLLHSFFEKCGFNIEVEKGL